MACGFAKLSYLLWSSTSRVLLKNAIIRPSFVLCRDFHIGEINFKRRKTKEEKVDILTNT